MGVLQVIWVSGSFKRKEKNAHIKNMGTPLLLNFKNMGGGTPPGPESYRRMFAVVVDSTASYHHSRSHLQSCSFNNWSHLSHLSLSSSGVSMISLGSLVLSSLGSSLLSPVADSQPKVGNTTAYGTSALQSSWSKWPKLDL